jgi:hypothetical protein
MDSEAARRAGLCHVNAGDFTTGLEYLKKAENLGTAQSDLALPLAFASLKTGDVNGAAQYFRNARPRNRDELSIALSVLEAMAAEGAFRPYLTTCIRGREEAFGRAFPERFLKLMSETRAILPQDTMSSGVPNR